MNEDQTSTATLGIDYYVFVLMRQWRVLVGGALLGCLAAGGFLVLAPQTVTATTTVSLNVITTEPFSAQRAASGLLDDATEAAIARSHVVAARASEQIDGRLSPAEIRAASTVVTSSGAAVVTVAFEGETAGSAITGADAVASAYLSFRSEQARERIAVMVSNLTDRIDALNETLASINQQLTSADQNSVAYAQAATQRQQILTELEGLLSERNGLQSVDTTGGTVLSAAENNELAYAPGRTRTMLTGLAGGLVAGIIAAFAWNPLDRRLRNAGETARALGAPVFAEVDPRRAKIPAIGSAADALRIARERLLSEIYLGTTVLVVDATHRTYTSATAVNLAVATAQSGYSVQLIVPEAKEEWRSGLRQALALEGDVDGAGGAPNIPTLRFFNATDTRDDSQGDLFMTRQTHAAIDDAGEETLTFLILSAQAHPASILSAMRVAHSVIVIAREHATTTTEIRWIREEAAGTDTALLGAVIEKTSSHRATPDRTVPEA
ncbi:hypothetical protein [uncultured Microbacterium sp.]|uniref:hypothetical protein n=1 Tax=uncultured Microbacterium sp. TaxID=191216 RepID=UPI002627D9A7|nr:hypothetical protein [uncultured Microbacterium sp.]